MKYERTYNFSAGPAMMPEAVLEEIRDEMMNYRGSGMCVMEMSHRSKIFMQIAAEAEQDLRELMGIPENYKVLFVQGGGTVQFAMVAMNLLKDGTACYVETGTWSKKAISEAKKYGNVKVVASSKDKNFTYVPDCSDLDIPEDCDYVYICENETINGTTFNILPNTKGKILVSDQSSMFLSKPCNVSDYGLIWAGVQILKEYKPKGVMHCFSGSVETAKEIIDLGMMISFTGVLTFKNSKKAVEACEIIPIERIMLETDCPYMAPVPYRGERNNSSYVYYIAEKLAEIKNISVNVAIETCNNNAIRFFFIITL